jgi:hypothetical protein
MPSIFSRYIPVSTVVAEIDRIRTDEKILLCCEDRSVKELFVKKYGAHAIYSSHDLFNGTDDQRAIIDLMMLSRAKILIAPFISNFARCAAGVGDCEYIRLKGEFSQVAEELSEIANAIDGERQSGVKALIDRTAAELASDESIRAAVHTKRQVI